MNVKMRADSFININESEAPTQHASVEHDPYNPFASASEQEARNESEQTKDLRVVIPDQEEGDVQMGQTGDFK
jgi:hypothetical protein